MKPREIKPGIYWVGAIDWDRRLFDSLIPLPDGTSYNSYLIEGSGKTALIDTVDSTIPDALLNQLSKLGAKRIDYVVANHAEQGNSGHGSTGKMVEYEVRQLSKGFPQETGFRALDSMAATIAKKHKEYYFF